MNLVLASLDNTEDNGTQSWTSIQDTNITGEIKVTESFTRKEIKCRTVKQKINTNEQEIVSPMVMRRDSESDWENFNNLILFFFFINITITLKLIIS